MQKIIIGSDEVLKGDSFGGIVVAAVKADEKIREQLTLMHITDSKKISDRLIPVLTSRIKKIAPYSIRNLLPDDYNRLTKTNTVTVLLNQLHKEVKEDLGVGYHIVDKYPGCNVGDLMIEKAESKYIEVAAASIIARDEGLKQISFLSKKIGFEVPKGSTHVKEALIRLKESKKNPEFFVKMNFKNVIAILNN